MFAFRVGFEGRLRGFRGGPEQQVCLCPTYSLHLPIHMLINKCLSRILSCTIIIIISSIGRIIIVLGILRLFPFAKDLCQHLLDGLVWKPEGMLDEI